MAQLHCTTLSTEKAKSNPQQFKQPQQPTIQVHIEPLPLPPDFNSRLAKIYALALRRYHEHHQSENQEESAA
jgi:hypothetical protein